MRRRWDVAALRDRYYAGYNRFSAISRVMERTTPDAHVLEIGCGDGRNSPDLRGRVALYAGLGGKIRHIAQPPHYLGFHPAAYMVGVAYERTVERMFPRLRSRILVEAQKDPSTKPRPRTVTS